MTLTNHNFPYRAHSIAGALGAALQQLAHPQPAHEAQEVIPFVTISRQAGAGGRTLATRLAERLNALSGAGGGHKGDVAEWHAWDHELVEKVAKEHELPPALVETLEDTRHPWVKDFLFGLA